MAILDRVTNMKKEGLSDQEVSNKLLDEGIAPRAINDALNQAQIKKAVEGEQMETNETQDQQTYSPMPEQENYYPPSQPATVSQDYYSQQPQQQQEYYPQENYGGGYEEGYSNAGNIGTSTIMEVAEQVFEEKIKNIQKQLENLGEFATLSKTKIDNFEKRLEKIESTIETLQIKILERVGSYGQGIDSIKKEMSMMQDTFSKTLPKLATQKTPSKKSSTKKKSHSKRK